MKEEELEAYKGLGRNDRDIASRKGSKIPSVVMHEIESIVRMGLATVPTRLKLSDLREHYEPIESENIMSIDVFSVPTFPLGNGMQQFSNIVVLEVGEFSEVTRPEIMRVAHKVTTKVTKHKQQTCPNTTFILVTHREEKGFRMKFMRGGLAHKKAANGQGGEFWMVFNVRQGGPAIRKKVYEILGKWYDKRSSGVKNSAEKKGFVLFGALELCYKFVEALARALQKLADKIKILTKSEKEEIKKSCKMMHEAKLKGVEFSKRNGLWIEDEELTDSKRVWEKILMYGEAQSIFNLEEIAKQEINRLCNAVM